TWLKAGKATTRHRPGSPVPRAVELLTIAATSPACLPKIGPAGTMTKSEDHGPRVRFSTPTIDLAIRLGFLCLLGYWSLQVIAPFLTILLWSAILTVALYPLFEWLARWLGRRGLAAGLVTVLSLMIVVGPVAWLGFGLVNAAGSLMRGLENGQLAIPL